MPRAGPAAAQQDRAFQAVRRPTKTLDRLPIKALKYKAITSSFKNISSNSYYAISIPIGVVTFALLGTGAWIGWTILTIKVVPPMPDIVERKDYAKVKAFFLCVLALALAQFA